MGKNPQKKSPQPKKQIVAPIKRGRPSNRRNIQQTIELPNIYKLKKEGLIIHYPICIKLMKILSHSGQVKVKTLSGDRKELKKVQKEIEQNQKCKLQQVDGQDQSNFEQQFQKRNFSHQFYFISECTKAKLIFVDGLLEEMASYPQISQESLFDGQQVCPEVTQLLYKINLVCKELNDQFINELQEILKFYFENMSKIDLADQIVRFISESDFPYIKEWEQVKQNVYIQQLCFAKESFEYQLKNSRYKIENGVCKANNENLIQRKLKKIKEEMNLSPLKYLIESIVKLLDIELMSLNFNIGRIEPESNSNTDPYDISFSDYFV